MCELGPSPFVPARFSLQAFNNDNVSVIFNNDNI